MFFVFFFHLFTLRDKFSLHSNGQRFLLKVNYTLSRNNNCFSPPTWSEQAFWGLGGGGVQLWLVCNFPVISCSSDKLNACSSVILTPINKSSFKGIILLHSLWFFTNLLGDAPPPKNFYKWHFSFVLTGSDKPTSEWHSMTSSDYGSRNHRRQEMGGTRDKQFPGEWLKRSPVSTQDIIDCHLTRTKSSRRLSRQPEPGISLNDWLSASTLRVYAAWRLFYLKAPNGIWFVT